MHKVIAITGTPGVGKSTLALKLAKKLPIKRIDLHDYYQEISTGYDRKNQCYDLEINKLTTLVRTLRKEDHLLLDSHIAHLLPKNLVDLCIVLICPDLKKLQKRLERRNYSKTKIQENLQAEIFQVCLEEASSRHKCLVVDVSKGYNFKKVLETVKKTL